MQLRAEKGAVLDLRHALGDLHLHDAALIKTELADDRKLPREMHRLQARAAPKELIGELRHAVGQRHLADRFAIAEERFAQRNAAREDGRLQIAQRECPIDDALDLRGPIPVHRPPLIPDQMTEPYHKSLGLTLVPGGMIEYLPADIFDVGGKRDLAERGAVAKEAALQPLHPFGQGDPFERLAARKCRRPDLFDAFGEVDRLQRFASGEATGADRMKRRGKGDLCKRASAERVRGQRRERLGKLRPFQPNVVLKGAFADRTDGIGDLDLLERNAVFEGARADLLEVLRQADLFGHDSVPSATVTRATSPVRSAFPRETSYPLPSASRV